MIKIIIATHGHLAEELLNTAIMIAGSQSNVETYGLEPGSDLDIYKGKIESSLIVSRQREVPVIILTDLFFGTPCNIVLQLSEEYHFSHITGVNLALLLEILMLKSSDILERIDELVNVGKESLRNLSLDTKEEVSL